jgi:hypothetical protein
MKRDERKRQKKRLKEQKKSARQSKHAAARSKEATYPEIIFHPEGGDPAFVATVREILAGFDYDNPDHCSQSMRQVFQMFRSVGTSEMFRRLDQSMKEAAQRGFDSKLVEDAFLGPLLMDLGEWVFDRLPEECRKSPLPFSYFVVLPGHREFHVYFAFLPSVASSHGRIYTPPLEPTVPFGGGSWRVGFFRHAIERICERLCPTQEITYAHFSTCAIYFRDCIYYEPLELPNGQHVIRLLRDCDSYVDGDSDPYITQVMGLDRHPGKSTRLYRILGYCPVAFVGPRAVAKTFLYPGYRGTPEDHLVRTAAMSAAERRELLEMADDNHAGKAFKKGGLDAIRWYHLNGIPQVFELDRKVFHTR